MTDKLKCYSDWPWSQPSSVWAKRLVPSTDWTCIYKVYCFGKDRRMEVILDPLEMTSQSLVLRQISQMIINASC